METSIEGCRTAPITLTNVICNPQAMDTIAIFGAEYEYKKDEA
jgi:hypothetical protein